MHRISGLVVGLLLLGAGRGETPGSTPPDKQAAKSSGCRTEVLEGQVKAGEAFDKPIGSGLSLLLQPIQSGWILRVIPSASPRGEVGSPGFLDYAELATPPYESVTPLSISTDFAFRSQDAVGWNPRRFRFASGPEAFARMKAEYDALVRGGAEKMAAERALAGEVASAPEGLFTIVDSRLLPGTADQSGTAAAVSANFTTTAHYLDLPAAGQGTPLGRIEWLRFRLELELPTGFAGAHGQKIAPHVCGTR